MRNKRVLTEDHETKILNVPDDHTILLLRDGNCHTRMQSIFKSFEKASSSKINFSKIQALWVGAYKNRIDKPGQIIWSQICIKILGVHFVKQKQLRHENISLQCKTFAIKFILKSFITNFFFEIL